MRISELGRETGVDIETIRYYERTGLLPKPRRRPNGYRDYGPPQLEQLAFIRHCRALDMSLADIRRLLGFVARPAGACGDVDRVIDNQLDRVRARLKSLRALERQLVLLRSRCEAPRAGARACGILEELVTTARHEASA